MRQEDAQRDNQDAIKKLKLSIGEKELGLKTANGQIAKYVKAMDTASNMKEMEALRTQVATVQAKVKELEDAVLADMAEIDERTTKLPELEKAVRQAREEYAKFEKGQSEKHADHQVQLKQTLDQLAQVEKQLPDNVRGQYERTIASMGSDGLACARNRICEACRTQITLQTHQDLQLHAFVFCSACGRILYPPETAPNPVVETDE